VRWWCREQGGGAPHEWWFGQCGEAGATSKYVHERDDAPWGCWRGQLPGDGAASKADSQQGLPCFFFFFYFTTMASPPVLDPIVMPQFIIVELNLTSPNQTGCDGHFEPPVMGNSISK